MPLNPPWDQEARQLLPPFGIQRLSHACVVHGTKVKCVGHIVDLEKKGGLHISSAGQRKAFLSSRRSHICERSLARLPSGMFLRAIRPSLPPFGRQGLPFVLTPSWRSPFSRVFSYLFEPVCCEETNPFRKTWKDFCESPSAVLKKLASAWQ